MIWNALGLLIAAANGVAAYASFTEGRPVLACVSAFLCALVLFLVARDVGVIA